MDVTLRPGRPDDAVACGTICYEAFKAIAERHHFVPDFPSAEAAIGIIGTLLSHPGFYGVVAELNGRVVGSNFLDERSTIAGLGPITVEPSVQDRQIGRALMAAAWAVRRRAAVPACGWSNPRTTPGPWPCTPSSVSSPASRWSCCRGP